jgi:glycyl-tRNA synthetase alpha chain
MALTFCEIINELTKFWVKNGCGIAQGSNTEVGAGTLSNTTLLNTLTNDKYKICYVQPSTRPADGRYGENPNRLYTHHQFQVIFKDDNFTQSTQDLYLQSLKAIGIDFSINDIRFIEDDWKNPSVGAFGLGWEVWYNGMEVTQFTFMQQLGGIKCDIIPTEITYGLERLVMLIQNKNHVMDIDYSEGKKYGEIFKNIEYDFSDYALAHSNVNILKRHFDDYISEAQRFIDLKNPYVAYDFTIKASHLVNLLDARNAISISQRTEFLIQMKNLVQQSCTLLLERK